MIWHPSKRQNKIGIVPIKTFLIKISILAKAKQITILVLKILSILWFISACAYEPETIVKTPRNYKKTIIPVMKKSKPLELALIKNPSKELTKSTKKTLQLPMISIDLSKFKDNLIGLNNFEILELLNQPNFRRTEHPASIWQYESDICFLDIFFYYQKPDLLVDFAEIRSKNIKKINEKLCVSSLLDSEFKKKNNQNDR